MNFGRNILFLLALTTLVLACKQTDSTGGGALSAENLETELQEALINAKTGDVILLPEGTFSFRRSLSFEEIPGVTIKGAGKGKTILSFKDQIEGAQGLLVKAVEGITLEGFTVADSKGDAIKVQDCKDVIMRDLEATWTGGPTAENGAYGLYPVSCTNVLMEKCEASYAMDAGIYVGQTTNILIRDNYAHHNVAGIEIENSINGEVYNNIAKENTGGLLIFDMPDLPQANGSNIKIYDNQIENNNYQNFSAPGIVVNILPPGTGMVIMAHRDIEVYNNVIRGHKTQGIGILSWLFTERPFESPEYDPFCSGLNIYDNTIENQQGPADTTTDFGKLFSAVFGGEAIDIVIDGIFNPEMIGENGLPSGDRGLCIRNNGEVSFANLNAAMGAAPEDMIKNKTTDMSGFNCELQALEVSGHDVWLD